MRTELVEGRRTSEAEDGAAGYMRRCDGAVIGALEP